MKLRNKKTGEIITLKDEGELALLKLVESSLPGGLSLWEEVKEPLIKDEKIRKAVRAWAEANEIGSQDTIRFDAIEHRLIWVSTAIEFNEFNALSDLEKTDYTIAELCGEEEK